MPSITLKQIEDLFDRKFDEKFEEKFDQKFKEVFDTALVPTNKTLSSIKGDVTSINKSLTSINTRLDKLEHKVDTLTESFYSFQVETIKGFNSVNQRIDKLTEVTLDMRTDINRHDLMIQSAIRYSHENAEEIARFRKTKSFSGLSSLKEPTP